MPLIRLAPLGTFSPQAGRRKKVSHGRTCTLRRRRRDRRRRLRPGRRDRGPARRRDRRQSDRSRAVRRQRTPGRRPAACRSRRDGLDRRRADPARLRPCAARRSGDLGDQARGSRLDAERHRQRRQGFAAGDDQHNDLQLLCELRGGIKRGADRPRRAHLGRRQAARSRRLELSHLRWQRDANARSR